MKGCLRAAFLFFVWVIDKFAYRQTPGNEICGIIKLFNLLKSYVIEK